MADLRKVKSSPGQMTCIHLPPQCPNNPCLSWRNGEGSGEKGEREGKQHVFTCTDPGPSVDLDLPAARASNSRAQFF